MNAIQTLLTEHLDIWTDADTEKKSGRGRSASNAASVYGIKKLRELILELAVRGKLVPQDANDEPASVLLKRILAEKAKLIADGKIKKEKPLPPITEDEKPYALPDGWEWVRLGDTGKIFNGNSINENEKLKKYTNLKEGLPFIATKDVGYGRDELDYKNGVLIPFENEKFKIAHEGAILICSEGGSAGKKIGISNMDICFGNKLYANEVWTSLAPRFIFYVYQSPCFFKSFSERMTGIIGGISINEFLNIPIPIPSKNEQKRIIAKVDELMALCDQLEIQHANADAAHEKLVNHLLATLAQSQNAADFNANWQRIAAHFDTLFATEASIDTLKQTLLQLAVMGKLVPQDPNDEPASTLLKRVQSEKTKLVAEGKIKKDKPLPPIADDEKPFALPQGWEWMRFNDSINPEYQISYGVLVPGADENDGIPFVRIADLDIKNPPEKPEKSISREIDSQYERTRLEGGEILMGVVGSIGKLGVVPISWRGANIARAICRIKVSDFLNRDYIVTLLQSKFMQNNFIGDTKTLAQPTLNVGLIRLSLTPLPPIEEQHRIVAKVDELMALCEQLKTCLTQANQLQQKLADVVVEQALI